MLCRESVQLFICSVRPLMEINTDIITLTPKAVFANQTRPIWDIL